MPVSPNIGTEYGEEVAEVYRDAELAILRRIAAAIARGIDAPDWEVAALARQQDLRNAAIAELNKVNAASAAAITKALNDAYKAGGLAMFEDVGDAIDPVAAGTPARRAAVAALAERIVDGVTDARPAILRAVDDVFREVVGRAVIGTAAGGVGRVEAAQDALNELLGQGIRGIEVGRGTMTLPNYVSMAVRTGTAQAAIVGHTDTMQANGLDLVVIHPGPRACDICDDWARKILSIDSSTPPGVYTFNDFSGPGEVEVEVDASLDDARDDGWGHPNCRCGCGAFIPGVTDTSIIDRPPWDEAGYQAQQEQRGLEAAIREWKDREALAITPEAQAIAEGKVDQYQSAMSDHLAANPDLKRQYDREQPGRVM